MINQMRIYGLYEDTREAFLERFCDHAARIMRDAHGFRILAMWETRRAAGASEEDSESLCAADRALRRAPRRRRSSSSAAICRSAQSRRTKSCVVPSWERAA